MATAVPVSATALPPPSVVVAFAVLAVLLLAELLMLGRSDSREEWEESSWMLGNGFRRSVVVGYDAKKKGQERRNNLRTAL